MAVQHTKKSDPVLENLVEEEVLSEALDRPEAQTLYTVLGTKSAYPGNLCHKLDGFLESSDELVGKSKIGKLKVLDDVLQVTPDELAFLNGSLHPAA